MSKCDSCRERILWFMNRISFTAKAECKRPDIANFSKCLDYKKFCSKDILENETYADSSNYMTSAFFIPQKTLFNTKKILKNPNKKKG